MAAPGLWIKEESRNSWCVWEAADAPEYMKPSLQLHLYGSTRADFISWTQDWERSTVSGREARFLLNSPHQAGLHVLSKEGVEFGMAIGNPMKEPSALEKEAETLAAGVLQQIQKQFPGKYEFPSRSVASIDPCNLFTKQEAERYMVPWSEFGIHVTKYQQFGGRFAGALSCAYSGATSLEEDKEGIGNEVEIRIADEQLSVDHMQLLQGDSERIRGLGTFAYWVPPKRLHSFHDPAPLAILTKEGRRVDVLLHLHIPGSAGEEHLPPDQLKSVALEIGKLILSRVE